MQNELDLIELGTRVCNCLSNENYDRQFTNFIIAVRTASAILQARENV